MRQRQEVKVLLSCPGDCDAEREIARSVLTELNSTTAADLGFFLQPFDWREAPPGAGDAQTIIDHIIGDYEVVIGIMWLRYGTLLPDSEQSGTEHEIQLALSRWRRLGQPRVMFYFNRAVPPSLDHVSPDQFARVKSFRERLRQLALTQDFSDPLDFERRVRSHLHRVLQLFSQQRESSSGSPVRSANDALGGHRIKRFVHGRLTPARGLLETANMSSPYDILFDSDQYEDADKTSTVEIFVSFPHSGSVKKALGGDTLTATALCVIQSEATMVAAEMLLGSYKTHLLERTPSRVWQDERRRIISLLPGVLTNCFLASGGFSQVVTAAGRKKPEFSYQMMVDLFLAPIFALHEELGFRSIRCYVSNVGDKTGALIGVTKRAAKAILPGRNCVEVSSLSESEERVLFLKIARFVDWAVGSAYRSGKDDWLRMLERAFEE